MSSYIKLIFAFLLFTLSFRQVFSQTESVTCTANLDEILYLKVTSGRDIQFVFNTITQLKSGIANTDRYDTKFTVTSSVNYNVFMFAEDATFMNIGAAALPLFPLSNVDYFVSYTGGGLAVGVDISIVAAVTALTNAAGTQIVSNITNNYGDNLKNAYTINWSCGTNGATMLSQSLKEDTYVTNVILQLQEDF